jgi:hypothetical protein
VIAATLMLGAALLSTCAALPEDPTSVCPQVYRIAGDLSPKESVNLLFIPHGFHEDELVKFRCAARLLTTKLGTIDPYRRAAPGINVYRLDLAIGQGLEELIPVCNGIRCRTEPTVWSDEDVAAECGPELSGGPEALGTPTRGESEIIGECMLFDPKVQACPGGNTSCRLSWPSTEGLRQLWRLSNCAPNIHAVIVVTNNGAKSGGGSDAMDPSIIVTTMGGIDGKNTRGNVLIHELGHAFGLLDEYSHGAIRVGGKLPGYHAGRNVFSTIEGDEIPPWKQACTETSPGQTTQSDCFLIAGEGCNGYSSGEEGAATSAQIGLFEGACYRPCGYYRAQKACRMFDSSDETFCAGCKIYINKLIDDLELPGTTVEE